MAAGFGPSDRDPPVGMIDAPIVAQHPLGCGAIQSHGLGSVPQGVGREAAFQDCRPVGVSEASGLLAVIIERDAEVAPARVEERDAAVEEGAVTVHLLEVGLAQEGGTAAREDGRGTVRVDAVVRDDGPSAGTDPGGERRIVAVLVVSGACLGGRDDEVHPPVAMSAAKSAPSAAVVSRICPSASRALRASAYTSVPSA